MKKLILKTTSRDEVGVVARISALTKKSGVNVAAKYGQRVGGWWLGTTVVSGEGAALRGFMAACKTTLATDHPVFLAFHRQIQTRDLGALPYVVRLYAYDAVGIVSDASVCFASAGANITELASCTYPAPQTGTPLFVVEMKIDVPSGSVARKLARELANLADRNGWDLDFELDASASSESEANFPPSRQLVAAAERN